MNLEPVDGREVVRCDKCHLVQFKRESEVCVKCKTSYAPARMQENSCQPAVKDGSADTSPSSGESFAAQSALPHLPQTLRQFRLDLGLSQRQMSARMGIPRTYISKIEQGKCLPTLRSFQRIAAALNVSPADLVEGSQRTERDPFVLEVFEGSRKLPQRQKDYIVDMVRQLATTERKATA